MNACVFVCGYSVRFTFPKCVQQKNLFSFLDGSYVLLGSIGQTEVVFEWETASIEYIVYILKINGIHAPMSTKCF